jgi:hypothetical protein
MKYRERVQCLINLREVQIALITGILSLILNRFYPQIQVWRLTPPSLPRQFFLTLEPATIVGVIAACIVGPWAGLIIAIFAPNPQFIPEVGIIISTVQFITIGYAHRKIQSPWNILAIPLGTVVISIIHPTIVGYILFKQVFVYLFFGTNMLFQTIVSLVAYLLVRFFVPQFFEWTRAREGHIH